jgi:glycosyltransferase involved in cell wall biosynthesis
MTQSTPLVSVIMIFLNGEQFIDEAIASVFAQTYPHWELLLVDDGSTDGSTEIARRYAARHPGRVRYLEHPGHHNSGMSASRNLGLKYSQGQYIAFLDADDVYLPQKLERQVALLEAHPEAAMVYGATQHWYSWSGHAADQGRDTYRSLGVEPDTLVRPPRLAVLFLQRRAQTPGTCGVLVRKAAVEQIGGFEEQFRGMFEDQVFFYKLCLHAPVFVESGSWDRYRQHYTSHSRAMSRRGAYSRKGRPNDAQRVFLRWLEGYIRQTRQGDDELRRALEHELWPYRHPLLFRLSHLPSALQALRALPDRGSDEHP